MIESGRDSEALQIDLDAVSRWASAWQLSWHIKKCGALYVGTGPSPQYFMNGFPLPIVSSIRDLGITYSNSLSFESHIAGLVKKAKYTTRSIFLAFPGHDRDFYLFLFKTYVRPLLEFSTPVWSPALKHLVTLVESVQKKFTKRLFSSCAHSISYPQRLRVLRLESLEERRIRFDLLALFRTVNSEYVHSSSEFFKFSGSTRRNADLLSVYRRTSKCSNFWSFRVVHYWNHLPLQIRNLHTLTAFKNALSSHKLADPCIGYAYA